MNPARSPTRAGGLVAVPRGPPSAAADGSGPTGSPRPGRPPP